MNDVVDRILNAYQLKRPLDAEQVADSRQRIERYIESLASAGQRDAPDRPALSFQDSIRSGRKASAVSMVLNAPQAIAELEVATGLSLR
jgi:hypothetical protein